ncbi:SgcJ/EcaC family oxidoreductase [Deinococcus sonorensis]|uniref:SgcJ/EcaC family oxidoreductase n=2 Tax=Deinococcus sonorensis TaxID=309891 RepID=A0AAU7UCP3_9DEIO
MTLTDKDAVLYAIRHLVDRWRTLDPQRFAASFSEDAEFTDVVGNTARGRPAIAELHVMPFTRLFREAVIDVGDTPIRFVTPEVASVGVHWTMHGHTSAQGEVLPPRQGILHVVVAQQDGQWWPVVAHNTDHTAVYSRSSAEPAPGHNG